MNMKIMYLISKICKTIFKIIENKAFLNNIENNTINSIEKIINDKIILKKY